MNCSAEQIGITKKTLKKIQDNGQNKNDIIRFIHGDINDFYSIFCKKTILKQSWERPAKRFVHLEEARFIAKHFLRHSIILEHNRGLVLAGSDPIKACFPWSIANIVESFDAYEKDYKTYCQAKGFLHLNPTTKIKDLRLIHKDVFDISNDQKYGIIDLDFCNNHLSTIQSRQNLLDLLQRLSPNESTFVFRTTLHLGRTNSKEEVIEHIDIFNESLRKVYRIRACDSSPYQSSLPMMSLIWILEPLNKREERFAE